MPSHGKGHRFDPCTAHQNQARAGFPAGFSFVRSLFGGAVNVTYTDKNGTNTGQNGMFAAVSGFRHEKARCGGYIAAGFIAL